MLWNILTTTVAALAMVRRTAGIDPAFAVNITSYHINPFPKGPVPLNMNVADAAGDLFFDLFIVVIYPVFCPDGPASGSHCDNPEAYDDLVVNELTIEMDSRFGGYSMCNIGMHGTDGHGHPCKDGTYCCYCDDYREPQLPCNASVGYENTTMRFGQFVGHCKHASDIVEKAECWRANSPAKMGGPLYSGGWYSPESTGCSDPLNPTDNCTWRVVSVDNVINRTCHRNQFFNAVREFNSTCFDACPSINNTDSCNIACFYGNVLGPDANVPGGTVNMTTGIPTPQLVDMWLSGFRPEAQGGCPRLPIPSPLTISP